MPNPIKSYKQARKQKKQAEAEIKATKPKIAAKKVEGAIIRGERVSIAQTRKLTGNEFDNGAVRRKNPKNSKVR
jgi:hypothetical protein